jgi:hypothetical protein
VLLGFPVAQSCPEWQGDRLLLKLKHDADAPHGRDESPLTFVPQHQPHTPETLD